MWRVILCLVTLGAASCAGPTAIDGPYARRLSAEDIRQIRALVLMRREWAAVGPGPSLSISADRPDHANIDTFQVFPGGNMNTSFAASKVRGRWTVDNPDAEPIIIFAGGDSGGMSGFGL